MTRFRLLWAAFFCFTPVSTAFATSLCPAYSYKKLSPDGKYVFIMIPPISIEDDLLSWNEEARSRIVEIRKRYARSGLYLNDNSVDPLWTFDWYAFDVEIASDGVHHKAPDGSVIVLDLATGEVVSVSHPSDIARWIVSTLSATWIFGCIIVIVARRSRRSATRY